MFVSQAYRTDKAQSFKVVHTPVPSRQLSAVRATQPIRRFKSRAVQITTTIIERLVVSQIAGVVGRLREGSP